MSTPWVLAHKLALPVPAGPRLERDLAAGAPVTLLVGGAGYGKSHALLALVERAVAGGAVPLWVALEASDADAATFCHYLVAGLRLHVPTFGEALLTELQAGAAPAAWLPRFFAAVAAYGMPGLAIALDDAHHLFEDAGLVAALGACFDKLPPGVRLFAAMRRRWPQPLGRLAARGHVALVEQAALAFTPAEAGAFLAARTADAAVLAGWQAPAARLEGWPLGLELVARGHLPQGPLVTDYLAEEVFAAQDAARRDFMLAAAALPDLAPDACRAVLDREDAATMLEALAQDQLLGRLLDPEGGAVRYRFPAYMRAFLQQEVVRTVPLAERRQRAAAVAAHHAALGQDELALEAWLAADAPGPAAEAAARCFPVMAACGRQGPLEAALAAFPASAREETPALLYWRAALAQRARRAAEAEALYRRARAAAGAAGDAAGQLKALVRLAQNALMAGDEAGFIAWRDAAAPLLAAGRGEDVADLALIEGLAADQRGDMVAMGRHNQRVLAVPLDHAAVAEAHVIAHQNLHTLRLHEGALADAAGHAERAIAVATAWGSEAGRVGATFLLANLDLLRGDFDAADALLRGLPTGWEARLDWHDAACARCVLGRYHGARGDAARAEDELARALRLFDEADYQQGRKVPLELLVEQALARGQHARAEAWLAKAGPLDGRSYYDTSLAVLQARAVHLAGRPGEAAAALAALVPALTAQGAWLGLARARLYEAAALRAAGRPADEAAGAARALVAAHGYGFLERQEPEAWQALGPAAPPTSVARAPAAEAPAAAAPAVGPPVLDMRLFGGLEVRLDGRPVDLGARKVVRQILAALALYPRGRRAADLAEALGDPSANTLKVGLSLLRHALEPAMGKGEASCYVLNDEGRYTLAHVGDCDVRVFGEAIARALGEPDAEGAAACERVLALYRGDLADEPALVGCFAAEAEAFRQQALAAALRLAAFHQRRGDATGQLAALARATAIDPCDERATLAQIAHHAAANRITLARQAYWDCRKALKAANGDDPSADLEAAHRALPRGTGMLVAPR